MKPKEITVKPEHKSIKQLNAAIKLIEQASEALKQTPQASTVGQLGAREAAKDSLQSAIYSIQNEIAQIELLEGLD